MYHVGHKGDSDACCFDFGGKSVEIKRNVDLWLPFPSLLPCSLFFLSKYKDGLLFGNSAVAE